MSNEIEGIKEREKVMKDEFQMKMEGRFLEWQEEMKKIWEMIGAGAEAAKVVEDPRPKAPTRKNAKTERDLGQRRGKL